MEHRTLELSNSCVCQNHLEGLLKHWLWGPPVDFLINYFWSGSREPAFWTSSNVMPMLRVGDHPVLVSKWGNEGTERQKSISKLSVSLFQLGPKGNTKDGGSGQRDWLPWMEKVPNDSLQLVRICVSLLWNYSEGFIRNFLYSFSDCCEKR